MVLGIFTTVSTLPSLPYKDIGSFEGECVGVGFLVLPHWRMILNSSLLGNKTKMHIWMDHACTLTWVQACLML